MKKEVVLLKWVAVALCFSIVVAVGAAQEVCAGCGNERVDCNINKGTKTVGHSNFSYCQHWSWKVWECGCRPCHGYAHLAKWCNENVEKCNGECWGCARYESACYDSKGERRKAYKDIF